MNAIMPFHSPNIVWDSTIAIYLFLLGIASGTTILALWYKHRYSLRQPDKNWLIKSAVFVAPISVIIGLLLLIFHLTKPWTFWYLMFNYQLNSVMSMGVMMFQLYMATIFLWIIILFRQPITQFLSPHFPRLLKLLPMAARRIKLVELLLLFLALTLGAYTGFLLSALISYPMLNNPVLPILFLVSGLSSGVAILMITTLTIGKCSPHSQEIVFLHKVELPIILGEIFLLFCFFVGLYFGGGKKTESVITAFSGLWGNIFWFGVILLGILFPLLANTLASHRLKHNKIFILLIACCSLIGILCLRYFILYAGQMTIA